MEFLKREGIRKVKKLPQRAATSKSDPHGLHLISLLSQIGGRIRMGSGDIPVHGGPSD